MDYSCAARCRHWRRQWSYAAALEFIAVVRSLCGCWYGCNRAVSLSTRLAEQHAVAGGVGVSRLRNRRRSCGELSETQRIEIGSAGTLSRLFLLHCNFTLRTPRTYVLF